MRTNFGGDGFFGEIRRDENQIGEDVLGIRERRTTHNFRRGSGLLKDQEGRIWMEASNGIVSDTDTGKRPKRGGRIRQCGALMRRNHEQRENASLGVWNKRSGPAGDWVEKKMEKAQKEKY